MAINFPSSPSVNDSHTANGKTWIWNGEYWKLYGAQIKGVSLEISDTPPSNPVPGDMWFESDTGSTFTYYDGAWVELGNTAAVTTFLTDADGDTIVHVEDSADEDTIRFDTAGSERLTIDSLGNVAVDTDTLYVDSTNDRVGINDSTPSYTLDVTGDINASGDVRIGGTSLGRGVLDSDETGADFSLSTSDTDIMNITFTLSSTRKVMIAAAVPLVDFGTGCTNVYSKFQDTNAAGSPSNYYGSFHAVITTNNFAQATYYNVTALAAGTYTVYWVAVANAGTPRFNGSTTTDKRHQLTAIDLGAV